MLKLEYTNKTDHPTSDQAFRKLIRRINKSFPKIFPKQINSKNDQIIHLTFINDSEMKMLNKKFRRKDETTDVISLTYLNEKSFPKDNILGEVFISIDTARKQAQKVDDDLAHELVFLFVHGVLHVLGYDHQTEEDYEYMMKLTNQILGPTSSP